MLEINDESGLSQHKGRLSVHIVNYITKKLTLCIFISTPGPYDAAARARILIMRYLTCIRRK